LNTGTWALSKLFRRECHNLVYCFRARQQHNQPVDTQGYAGRWGHLRQLIKEGFRQGIDPFVASLPVLPFLDKPLSLLLWIGQLGKGVGQFDPGNIQLETFRNAWVVRFQARKGSPLRWEIMDEGGAVNSEIRLDLLHHDLVEDVPLQCFFHRDAAIAHERFHYSQPFPSPFQIDRDSISPNLAAKTCRFGHRP